MNLEIYPFYEDLDEEIQNYLRLRLKPVEIPAQSVLFFQGDVCDSILFLQEGEVALRAATQNGDEKLLYTQKPGELSMVNVVSTLAEEPALATAITLQDSKGYILDIYSLQELIGKSDLFQKFVFSVFSNKIAHLFALDIKEETTQLDTKIIEWLSYQPDKEANITTAALAEELHVNEETLSSVLQSLQNDGLLEIKEETIRLKG